MKFRTFLTIASVAFTAPLATAAITLQDSGGIAKTQSSAGTITVTSAELDNFDAQGTSKLVVTVSGERGGSGPYAHASVTYGGVEMTKIFGTETDNAARHISMWYLDNVAVTGDFVVDFGGNGSGVGLAAVALNGTAAGVTASNFAAEGSSTTLPTVSGQFVMALGMANGSSAPTADSPLTQLYSGDTGSSVGAAGYQFVSSNGTTTPTFTGATGVGAASFTAIPEPTAALLGGLGALLLLRRRRI